MARPNRHQKSTEQKVIVADPTAEDIERWRTAYERSAAVNARLRQQLRILELERETGELRAEVEKLRRETRRSDERDAWSYSNSYSEGESHTYSTGVAV